MPYIYENDPTKIGTNLQTAVAYLLSLHKNEYEWNLLGIKVIGVKEALPIPDGTYDYGDAYMIGNEADGYEMWIYTRADEAHSEAYWFNVGAFPKPGPQGPKGDGFETLTSISTGTPSDVGYDTLYGIIMTSNATINYKDSTTGALKSQTATLDSEIPILPGKYVSMNATNVTSDRKAIEVKVDNTALALDYYRIDKSQITSTIPYWDGTSHSGTLKVASNSVGNSVAKRDANGDCSFNKINLSSNGFTIGSYNYTNAVMSYGLKIDLTIADQSGGTLTATESNYINNYAVCRPVINGRVYNRITPLNYVTTTTVKFMSCDDNGTILILTCDTTNKTYTISTLASQATEIYRHGITMNDANIVVKLDIYDSNSQNYTYEQLKAKLTTSASYCANARIKRSDNTYYYSPATIAYWNDSTGDFALTYNNTEGNSVNVNWTPSVVSDNGTQIL